MNKLIKCLASIKQIKLKKKEAFSRITTENNVEKPDVVKAKEALH